MKPRGTLHHGKRVANKVYKRVTELSWQRLRLSDCRRFRDIASCRKSPILTYLTCIWRLRWGWPRLSFTEIFGVGRKEGDDVPLSRWGAGSPPNTMWPGPRSTSVPSGILIHPAVWPQYSWAKNWVGPCPFFLGELGPHRTQSHLGIVLFISFFLFGAHVRAVFLPLSPASTLVMVALCNRADHYIFMLWFVLSSSFFFLFFFLA